MTGRRNSFLYETDSDTCSASRTRYCMFNTHSHACAFLRHVYKYNIHGIYIVHDYILYMYLPHLLQPCGRNICHTFCTGTCIHIIHNCMCVYSKCMHVHVHVYTTCTGIYIVCGIYMYIVYMYIQCTCIQCLCIPFHSQPHLPPSLPLSLSPPSLSLPLSLSLSLSLPPSPH